MIVQASLLPETRYQPVSQLLSSCRNNVGYCRAQLNKARAELEVAQEWLGDIQSVEEVDRRTEVDIALGQALLKVRDVLLLLENEEGSLHQAQNQASIESMRARQFYDTIQSSLRDATR